jgi:hypothetical protein
MRTFDHRFARALLFAIMLAGSSAEATTISYSGVVVDYTVPTTELYDITTAGAEGGPGDTAAGGLGAVIGGDVILTSGTVLQIVVGGEGSTGDFDGLWGGGGGGGSFVYILGGLQPLIVAGGGGGAGYFGLGVPGGSGQTSTAGQAGFGPGGGTGGTAGSGGGGGTGDGGNFNGGGGGGWSGNGGNGLGTAPGTGTGSAGDGGIGAPTFAAGQGGGFGGQFANGGFGGGGGGGWQGGAGGGGYSGGGGGDGIDFAGGGGGSYISASFTDTTLLAGTNVGNGYVTIASAVVPEPATLSLFGLCLAGIGFASIGFARRRKTNLN